MTDNMKLSDFIDLLQGLLTENPEYTVVFGTQNGTMYFQIVKQDGICWKNSRYCRTSGIPFGRYDNLFKMIKYFLKFSEISFKENNC